MDPGRERYYRKIIRITAADSPNVKLMLEQQRRGLPVTDTVVVEGVLTAAEYRFREATWSEIRKCIGLYAAFWEGADELMYPPDWLNLSEQRADLLSGVKRSARGIGCDPAEGGDSTVWSVVDHLGLLEQIAIKTPNTAEIANRTLSLMKEYGVPAERVVFDRGGGGKQIADHLRERCAAPVRTVAFGESVTPPPKRGLTAFSDRIDQLEEKSIHVNRRAQLYYDLRDLLNPDGAYAIENGGVFAIPSRFAELRRQLDPIPKRSDPEGRNVMIPKSKPSPNYTGPTLIDLIGHSPDEADSLTLAIHAMLHKSTRKVAGTVR